MKKTLITGVLMLVAAQASAGVGVSVNVGEPGFYGRIDIGDTQPEVIYAEPVIGQRVRVVEEPVYLHVPPGHQKNWKRYCGRYDACGRPVYFVRDDWYQRVYVPQYREHHGHDHDDDRHDDDDHGPGRGRGHGHGHGHD